MSSEEFRDISIGAKVGHFTISKILGQGGFGLVAKAVDDQNHSLAIKFSDCFCEAMENEIEVLTALKDSAIVPEIFGSGAYKGYDFFTMEEMFGSLQDVLEMTGTKTFSAVVMQKILHQGISSLKALHGYGFIHQDIKAANLLLKAPRGPHNSTRIILGDMGLVASHADGKRVPDSICPAGCVPYATPAQKRGDVMTTWDDVIQLSYTPWSFQHLSIWNFLNSYSLEYKIGLLEDPNKHLPQALKWMLPFYSSIQESLLDSGVDYNVLTEAVQDMLRDTDGTDELRLIGGNECLS